MLFARFATGFALMAFAQLSLAAATSSTSVQTQPGAGLVTETVDISGTIVAIDKQTRVVTLDIEGEENLSIEAGPEVRNFDQLAVGDAVEMELIRALALELKKGSTAEVSRTDEAAKASAEPGSTPGGIVGKRVQVMAEVMALNAETKTVTLRGPNGSMDLQLQDPKQFENIAVGDRVQATYVEALAVQVTHAKPAEKK